MKEVGFWALDTAKLRGATHAEARIVDERRRELATRNGRIGSASDSESLGIGIRVIADGSFGFAATDDLTREGVQSCAAQAVQIAKASARVKSAELHLVPEPPHVADWASPCRIDPFGISLEKNLELLFAIDARDAKGKGRDAGRNQHEFQAIRAVVLLVRRFRNSSDLYHHRRWLRSAFLCRHRDPEAVVSELLRRPIPEQGI